MNLLRNPRFDLPVYSEDEVAWMPGDIRDAAQSGEESFVRRACLRYEGPDTNLQTVLALGDRVLSTVCETMFIDQVSHSWGLAPLSEINRHRLRVNVDPNTYDSSLTSYDESRSSLIPAGYGLVAFVNVVTDARALNYDQQERVIDWNPSGIGVRIDGYRVSNEDLGREAQFISDPAKLELGGSGIVLVDVEPRLRLTPVSDY